MCVCVVDDFRMIADVLYTFQAKMGPQGVRNNLIGQPTLHQPQQTAPTAALLQQSSIVTDPNKVTSADLYSSGSSILRSSELLHK